MPGLKGKNIRIAEKVVIEEGATLGNNVAIYDNVIIRKGATIGDNAVIGYYERECPGAVTEIGEDVKIRSGVVIYHSCIFGQGSSVGHNTVIREKTVVGHHTYIGALIMMEGEITIGNYCGINAQCHITRFSQIDDYVFFGPGIMSMNDNSMAHKRRGHGQNMKGFTARNYVRVGGGCTLLPGVVLEEGCIVGAGSLVTKDVPLYTLVKGRPARVDQSTIIDIKAEIVED